MSSNQVSQTMALWVLLSDRVLFIKGLHHYMLDWASSGCSVHSLPPEDAISPLLLGGDHPHPVHQETASVMSERTG